MKRFRDFDNGERIITAYHGSDVPISNFDRDVTGVFWFSEDKDKIVSGDSGASVVIKYIMKCNLTINKVAGWDEYERLMLDQIEAMGYDSIKLDDNWVIFDNKRIQVIDIISI
jgi:hypothetical protein